MYAPVVGPTIRRQCSFVSLLGETIIEDSGVGIRIPYDFFLDSFPPIHIARIVELTTDSLVRHELAATRKFQHNKM